MVIWFFKPNAIKEELQKMNKIECICCKKRLPLSSFWRIKANPPVRKDYMQLEKYDTKCKQCYLQEINYQDIRTILPILQHFNVPYIQDEWNRTYDLYHNKPGSVIGRYLSKMKLLAYYNFGFNDSDWFNSRKE